MNKIALIGAGQIGKRHLQALLTCSLPFTLEIVDPDIDSIEIAKKLVTKKGDISGVKTVNYSLSPDSLSKEIDLCIIATSANVRFSVLQNLIKNTKVNNLLLEKILFQSIDDYFRARDIIEKHTINTWVNCPRRMYNVYGEIKKLLSGDTKLSYTLTGGDWGLGCNAIHFIDLLAYLTGSEISAIDNTGLDNVIKESKRSGFIEFTGTLHATFENGSVLRMESMSGSSEPIMFTIETSKYILTISEKDRIMKLKDKKTEECKTVLFDVPYQSNLTNIVAEELLLTGKCHLTTFNESMRLHLPLIKSLLGYYNSVNGSTSCVLPIT